MFGDPLSITIGGTAYTLNRTGSGMDQGSFKTSDGVYTVSVGHAYNKRTRRTIRLDYRALAADVMDASINVPYSMSTLVVMDVPNVGITPTAQINQASGLLTFLTASTNAKLTTFANGEA